MAEAEAEERSLEQTPSWVVAVVCTVFVVASLLLERSIHRLGKYFKKTDKKELFHTLEQIKNELMLLGFISLLLTVFQPKVASICMAEHLIHRMLPCKDAHPAETTEGEQPGDEVPAGRRRLFATEATTTSTCSAGKVPVISVEGLHQLHIFIFVLAVIHVFYSCITVLIGLAQVHSWKKWETLAKQEGSLAAEQAIRTKHHKGEQHKADKAGQQPQKGDQHHNFTKDRVKYKFLQQSRTGLNLDAYIYSFFRQFGKPIYKSDYLCLRLGFIAFHQLEPTYDFHSYIRRSMEQDFKRVVGISAYLWAFVCLFLLLDINGWYTYFWIAFIPTILVLIVGQKLQHIILDLAIEIRGGVEKLGFSTLDDMDDDFKKADEAIVVKPMKPRDDLFWFRSPRLLITLIHFVLFQNAFELAFFFWAMYTYGFNSCLVGKKWMIIVRLSAGIFVQILCSASTLPLYALVSQMGSTIKFTVFNSEHTANAVQGWRAKAAKKHQPKSMHRRLSHHLGGIVGLNKTTDGHGHAKDIELPPHHKLSNGQGQSHNHPHPHPHPQPHDEDSHSVEIHPSPMIISNNSSSTTAPTSSEPAKTTTTPKPSAFANLTKIALEKQKEKNRDPEANHIEDAP